MFASSPALNALEHPVYDIWVLDCGGKALAEGERVPGAGARDGKDLKLPDLKKLFNSNR